MSQFWLDTFTKVLLKKNEWKWCMILPIKTKIQQVIVCVNSSTSFVSGILPIKTKIQQVSTSFVCEFVFWTKKHEANKLGLK